VALDRKPILAPCAHCAGGGCGFLLVSLRSIFGRCFLVDVKFCRFGDELQGL